MTFFIPEQRRHAKVAAALRRGAVRKCQSGPNAGKPGVCPSGNSDEPAADSGNAPASSAATAVHAPATKVLKPRMDAVPKSPAKVAYFTRQTARDLAKLSVDSEADRAVDQLVSRDFKAIVQKYGPAMGTAIISTGYLAGFAGAGATIGIGGGIAAGAVMSHAYVAAIAAGITTILASPAVGQAAAKYAIAPLIGAARHLQAQGRAAKGSVDQAKVRAIAEKEWAALLSHWDAIDKTAWGAAA